MNLSKLFVLLVVIATFAAAVFSQKDDAYREEMMRQDQERNQKQLEENVKRWQNPNFDYLDSFLPSQKNSWYISITSTGGLLGGSRLVSAVNSYGNYTCGYRQDFSAQFAAKTQFETFSELVKTLDFAKLRVDRPSFFGCKDCISNILTFRKGKKTFEFQLLNNSVGAEIKQLHDQLVVLAPCN